MNEEFRAVLPFLAFAGGITALLGVFFFFLGRASERSRERFLEQFRRWHRRLFVATLSFIFLAAAWSWAIR